MASLSHGHKVPSVKQEFAKTYTLVGLLIGQNLGKQNSSSSCLVRSPPYTPCQKAGDWSDDKDTSRKVRKADWELNFDPGQARAGEQAPAGCKMEMLTPLVSCLSALHGRGRSPSLPRGLYAGFPKQKPKSPHLALFAASLFSCTGTATPGYKSHILPAKPAPWHRHHCSVGENLIIALNLVPAQDEASSTPESSRNWLRTEEAFN